MPNLIEFFDALTEDSACGFGEKAKGLVKLYNLGLAVPIGFCIHREAYGHYIKANGIYDKIVDYEKALKNPNGLSESEDVGDTVRSLIYETALQAHLLEQISGAYDSLKSRMGRHSSVAVRSSMILLSDHKLQYEVETFLNITDKDALIQAVKGCWASLWKDWAVSRREETGLSHLDVEMGVVVQELINAECSGVLYTSNPVSGSTDEIVIDACWGLGEGASQGRADTDNFVINKQSRIVVENIVEKALIVVPSEKGSGTMESAVPAERRKSCSLSANQIQGLIELALRVDRMIGPMQKVEWAWQKGRVFILQITSAT